MCTKYPTSFQSQSRSDMTRRDITGTPANLEQLILDTFPQHEQIPQ